MSFKIAFIGAGSLSFTRNLLRDVLTVKEFRDIRIAFTDINPDNLRMVTELCQKDIDENGLKIRIESTLDRRAALTGARYVVNCARIGLLEAFELDVEIPLKYGVDQCVGDTLCAGGIMYGQRGIAQLLEFCKDIREVAEKDALLLNYGNPNAMLTWACNRYGGVNTIGLCHGVQGGHALIARALGVPQEELDIVCAGINHQTWYIQLRYHGEDMTGKLLEAMENDPEIREHEKCRIDMLRRFGYFSTESNGHLSEYLPWYRKRTDEIKNWVSLDKWSFGETGGYLRICRETRNWFEYDFEEWMKEPPIDFDQYRRSSEHASYILEGLELGRVYRGHFNVVNRGCITNLPDDAIVEVPGYVDHNGVNIPRVGDLPLGCAAVCNASVSVQRLAVEAAVRGDEMLLKQAMMMDPLVGAVLNPPEIWQMTDEMLIAEEKWLPQYKEAIARAKERMKTTEPIAMKPYVSEVRLRERTLEEMEQEREKIRKVATAAEKAGLG